MKIMELLHEGMEWNGNSWTGGASDEGHADFDPLDPRRHQNNGFGKRPSRYDAPRPVRAARNMVPARMPYDAKDAFKDLVGKGNYAWHGETKTWYVNASILTPAIRQRLLQLNVEVVEK